MSSTKQLFCHWCSAELPRGSRDQTYENGIWFDICSECDKLRRGEY